MFRLLRLFLLPPSDSAGCQARGRPDGYLFIGPRVYICDSCVADFAPGSMEGELRSIPEHDLSATMKPCRDAQSHLLLMDLDSAEVAARQPAMNSQNRERSPVKADEPRAQAERRRSYRRIRFRRWRSVGAA